VSYVATASLPPWPPPERKELPIGLAVVALGGLVARYGLAFYLTRPIVRLRSAVRQLAAGDFSSRVDASLHTRRDEFGELGRDFDFMAERLADYIDNQRRLLSDVSHELRSPLARLVLAAELARELGGVEAGEALDRIEIEAGRLDALVGKVLTLARMRGGAELIRDPIDLSILVAEVAADADFEAQATGRSVTFHADDRFTTSGDESLLRSAVENVVRNGVRYTPEGSTVEVRIASASRDTQQFAEVTVRDNGPGVPAVRLRDIFRPFYRVDDARERQTGGAGLGLAITERAVTAHGGSVEAENTGAGLLVRLLIPARR
jgi:two-component system sensor histidine kinase CpxA